MSARWRGSGSFLDAVGGSFSLAGIGQAAVDVLGFCRLTAARFAADRCWQAAASLTYGALLALVPLTTITVAVLSAFPSFQDVQEGARALVADALVPQVSEAVLEHLEGFVANAGRLTTFGIGGLVVTALLLLATIESAFNDIWRVTESRSLLSRLLSFWAILTLTPVLVASSLSMTGQMLEEAPLVSRFVGIFPLVFEFVGFAILYWIIPNRSVHLWDSVVGAAVAAFLFEASKTGFAFYLTAFPVYETIYGALATIPTFLVWLYVAWVIILLGAEVAATLPDWRTGKLLGAGIEGLLPAPRLTIAVAILHELQVAARLGVPIARATLVGRVPVGGAALDAMLHQLRRAHFVERATGERWMLSRDLSLASLNDLVRALGIGLRGRVGGIAGIEGGWVDRLAEAVAASEERQAEALGMPLAALLADRPAEGRAAEGRAAEGRPSEAPRPGQAIPALRRGS